MEANKKRRISKNICRVSKEYPWKILGYLIKDISEDETNSIMMKAELAYASSIVRQRNVQLYVNACKERWALKSMLNFASALQSENLDQINILREIRKIRMLTAFQKFPFSQNANEPTIKAFKNFLRFEHLCSLTNQDPIFHLYKDDEDSPELSTYDNLVTTKIMRYIEEEISRILGDRPDLETLCANLRHGPGSTADKRGQRSILIEKFIPPISCTKSSEKLLQSTIMFDRRWYRSIADAGCFNDHIEYIEPSCEDILREATCSSLEFVKKTSDIDRTITIEPTGNMYLQLGIDHLIRKSLKKIGVDINTQEKNQYLARYASESNELVTIDLSSASDSIALTWLNFFPPKWCDLILTCRTHKTSVTDVRVCSDELILPLEKISSMGNGYTFSLETLIYTAIVSAVCRYHGYTLSSCIDMIAIYGDDIIVPKEIYGTLSYMLHRLGMRENMEKTFSHGPIRESCGMDYYLGKRIDRYTIKNIPAYDYEVCIHHNLFYTMSSNYGVSLPSVLKYISCHTTKKYYGPMIDDMCSWFFSDKNRTFYCSETQQLGYRTKRFVVKKKSTRSLLKNRLHIVAPFVPLMYLTSERTSKSFTPNFGRFRVTCDIYAYLSQISDDKQDDLFLYKKRLYKIVHVHAFVPLYVAEKY